MTIKKPITFLINADQFSGASLNEAVRLCAIYAKNHGGLPLSGAVVGTAEGLERWRLYCKDSEINSLFIEEQVASSHQANIELAKAVKGLMAEGITNFFIGTVDISLDNIVKQAKEAGANVIGYPVNLSKGLLTAQTKAGLAYLLGEILEVEYPKEAHPVPLNLAIKSFSKGLQIPNAQSVGFRNFRSLFESLPGVQILNEAGEDASMGAVSLNGGVAGAGLPLVVQVQYVPLSERNSFSTHCELEYLVLQAVENLEIEDVELTLASLEAEMTRTGVYLNPSFELPLAGEELAHWLHSRPLFRSLFENNQAAAA